MTRSFLEEFSREMLGVGPDWYLASWEDVGFDPTNPNDPNSKQKVTGYVAPLLADGKIAWKYKDKSTKRTLTFARCELRAWILDWEQRTGKCSECHPDNPGQEWIGWSAIDGHKFKTCSRCNGTNQAPHINAQATA